MSNVLLRYDDSSHGAVPYSITLRIRSLHLQDLRLETLTLTLALALTQTLALALALTLTLTLTMGVRWQCIEDHAPVLGPGVGLGLGVG